MTTTHLIHRVVLRRQPTAVIRSTIETSRIEHWLPLAYQAIEAYLSERGVVAAGPPFAQYAYRNGKTTVEAGLPLDTTIEGDGYVMPSALPHTTAGIAVHAGARTDLGQTYHAVRDWLALHGYAQDGPMWEVYLTDPRTHQDPATWRTEVIVPYRAL